MERIMKKKVLIVDDKEENRVVLENFFNFFGPNKEQIDLYFADSSEKAYELVKEIKPDLIFLDIFIETRTSGLELAKKIKEEFRDDNITIWAITASAMKASENEISDEEKCLNSGCDKYFAKPFKQKVMAEETSKLLGVDIPDYMKKRMGIE